MEPTTTCKQLKIFTGRVAYIHIFFSVVELLEPLHKILKKNASYKWVKEQQAAFPMVKDVFTSPLSMISYVKGLFLTFYLTSIDKHWSDISVEVERDELAPCI